MSTPRKITGFLKRPDFATPSKDKPSEPPAENPATQSSSPLTELSQLLPSDTTAPDTPGGPSSQLNRSLQNSVENSVEPAENDPAPQSSFQSNGTGTSQRVMKKGKEVVISSDGEESDSTGSLESPEDLLAMFLKPTDRKSQPTEQTMPLRDRNPPKSKGVPAWKLKPRKYKNSLSSLVTQAVNDVETEEGINKLKASIEADAVRQDEADEEHGGQVNEEALASAINDGADDSIGIQRLLDAVRRTEAFDVLKTWSFFDLKTPLPPAPDFPCDCVRPGTYSGVLREPDSRERAFHSGIIDFALSKGLLPDELAKWIFHSIPSETRDDLRHAYYRTLKRLSAERLKSLFQPEDIDTLFWQMSARPEALARSDLIVPDKNPQTKPLESEPQHHTALISTLGFFREAAHMFADDTRNHILSLLLRLPLDASLTRNPILCSEIERTIPVVLDAVPDGIADRLANDICGIAHATLKDIELQSRLLQHIVPVNEWIATLRRRLAYIFLTNDPSADVGTQGNRSEVRRITNILKHQRFDVKRSQRKDQPEYDYGELTSITTFLNIIIDSGWSETKFPDRMAENIFNSEVDLLAERVKKIFSAINDTGASHLKRTVAKEAMECLHYRIVYSVRTKPPAKKTMFGQYVSEDRAQSSLLSYAKKPDVPVPSDKPES